MQRAKRQDDQLAIWRGFACGLRERTIPIGRARKRMGMPYLLEAPGRAPPQDSAKRHGRAGGRSTGGSLIQERSCPEAEFCKVH